VHNLAFYLSLVKEARERILNGSFNSWKTDLIPNLERRL
jgi:queuine tRNA-ribosyltransferase